MARPRDRRFPRTAWLLAGLAASGCLPRASTWSQVVPEQRCLDLRDPAQLPKAPIPPLPPPPTVSNPPAPASPRELSLDEAIRIALANSKVVRVLAGTTAVSSGRTIYDPAISNTLIDEARAVFDPQIVVNNAVNRSEQPGAVPDPADPLGARIEGTRIDNYDLGLGVVKRTVTGATARLDVNANASETTPTARLLDPQARSAATLSFTQPLLQGAGVGPNLAPIVIARINTERSYFQLKDAVQELVRGVVDAYWAVVFARTDVWARQQQVQQAQEAFNRADARVRFELGNRAEVAQARVALAGFKASLIGAEANLLAREAALRNLLGLPPSEPDRIVPMTAPTPVRVEPKWEEITRLAEERRPDLIELKLILEADRQQLLIAQNQALPRVDATALYRWNGLEGETPGGGRVSSDGGQFTDWTLGVNFAVPLGLRHGRAALRRSELLLARDRANLDQGLHAALHDLAASVRNLAQAFEQYRAFQETRVAARENLDQQLAEFRVGRVIFLNALQAISDWGNAVSNEAQALTRYNTELANLERETGTILETHGVRFFEERFRSVGPLGRRGPEACYPAASFPGPNADKYPAGTKPAEEIFGLENPAVRKPTVPEPVPPPRPNPNE